MKPFTTPSDIDEIVNTTFDNAEKFREVFGGKRILITGACGFLGRYFVETFLRANQICREKGTPPCEIIAIDNLVGWTGTESASPCWPNDPSLAFVNHDVTKDFVPERPIDYVLYAAGIASPHHYRRLPILTLEVATKGFQNILAATGKNTRILYFSSSEIYGDPDPEHVPTSESYRGYVNSMGPRSCYDESKRLGETLAYIHHEQFDRSIMVVRPFNVYGPGMQKRDYRVLPNFAQKILEGNPVTVYGSGLQTRTFCYVTDAVRGFLLILANGEPGEAYNIGATGPEVSMIDLIEVIQKILKPDLEVKYEIAPHPESYPPDEPQRRCPSLLKAKIRLGYTPKVELEDGLERFFGWAKEAYR
jgi:UDP-glucuronate decarboxylase